MSWVRIVLCGYFPWLCVVSFPGLSIDSGGGWVGAVDGLGGVVVGGVGGSGLLPAPGFAEVGLRSLFSRARYS